MGLVSKRHSKWFRWIEKGKCSIRRDAFKMVLAHQAQSIPRGRFRGGRPPRRCRSYSNHVGNHTPPARRSSSPFASAEHTFAKESCCEWTFWRCEKRKKKSRRHDTPLVVLNKTAIRLSFSIAVVRPLSLAKVRWLLEEVSLYAFGLPCDTMPFHC